MVKLTKLLSVSILCFTLIISAFGVNQSVSAQSNEEVLVPPLLNASQQSEDDVDAHLVRMGFNNKEIVTLPLQMKQDIANKGGIKREVTNTESKVLKVGQDGEELIVPLYNDDYLYFSGYAVKTASYSSENEYDIYMNYNWKKDPRFHFTDLIAISWQSQGSPVAGKASSRHTYAAYINGGFTSRHFDNSLNSGSNLSGSAWDVKLLGLDFIEDYQYGYAKQTIRVPKSYEGTTAAFQLGYSHAVLPVSLSVSIGPLGIDFSGLGREDNLERYNFTY